MTLEIKATHEQLNSKGSLAAKLKAVEQALNLGIKPATYDEIYDIHQAHGPSGRPELLMYMLGQQNDQVTAEGSRSDQLKTVASQALNTGIQTAIYDAI